MRKAPRTAFKPGQKGNPRGRPKEYPEFKKACRKHSERALQVIIDALEATKTVFDSELGEIKTDEPDHKLRVMAANHLLDRAWGRPEQAAVGRALSELETRKLQAEVKILEHDAASSDRPAGPSVDEQRQRLEALRARYPELTNISGRDAHEDA